MAELSQVGGQYYKLTDDDELIRLTRDQFEAELFMQRQIQAGGGGIRTGMGHRAAELASGLRELTYGDPVEERLYRQEQDELMRPMQEYGRGSGIGEFLTDASTGLVGGMLVQSGVGALHGAADAPERPWIGAAQGVATTILGDQVANAVGRIGRTLWMRRNEVRGPEPGGAIEQAEELGYQFRPGQRGGGLQRQIMEQELARSPIFAGVDEKRWVRNQARLNRAAADFLGEDANNVTGEVMGRAYDRAKEAFKVVDNYDGMIEVDTGGIIRALDDVTMDGEAAMERFMNKYSNVMDGPVTGKQFMEARNWLASQARKSPELAEDYNAMIGVMDQGLEDSVDLATRQSVQQARQTWKALLTMEAAQRGAVQSASGNVAPLSAYNALRKYYGRNFEYGRMDDPFMVGVRGMSAANDIYPPRRPSGDPANWLNPVNRLRETFVETPLARRYMRGNSPLTDLLMGSTMDEAAVPLMGPLGTSTARGLLMGSDDEDSVN